MEEWGTRKAPKKSLVKRLKNRFTLKRNKVSPSPETQQIEEAERRIEELVKSFETAELVVNTLYSYKNSLGSINFRKVLNNGTRNNPNNLLQVLQAPSTKESFERATEMLTQIINEGDSIIMSLDVPNKNYKIETLIEIVDDINEKALSYRTQIEKLKAYFSNLQGKTQATKNNLLRANAQRAAAERVEAEQRRIADIERRINEQLAKARARQEVELLDDEIDYMKGIIKRNTQMKNKKAQTYSELLGTFQQQFMRVEPQGETVSLPGAVPSRESRVRQMVKKLEERPKKKQGLSWLKGQRWGGRRTRKNHKH